MAGAVVSTGTQIEVEDARGDGLVVADIKGKDWHSLLFDARPVDVGKERVALESFVTLHAQSLRWLELQESVNQ